MRTRPYITYNQTVTYIPTSVSKDLYMYLCHVSWKRQHIYTVNFTHYINTCYPVVGDITEHLYCVLIHNLKIKLNQSNLTL